MSCCLECTGSTDICLAGQFVFKFIEERYKNPLENKMFSNQIWLFGLISFGYLAEFRLVVWPNRH